MPLTLPQPIPAQRPRPQSIRDLPCNPCSSSAIAADPPTPIADVAPVTSLPRKPSLPARPQPQRGGSAGRRLLLSSLHSPPLQLSLPLRSTLQPLPSPHCTLLPAASPHADPPHAPSTNAAPLPATPPHAGPRLHHLRLLLARGNTFTLSPCPPCSPFHPASLALLCSSTLLTPAGEIDGGTDGRGEETRGSTEVVRVIR